MKREDRWKDLRSGLFRSVEPTVKLVAIPQLVGEFADETTPEGLPGFTARASHESQGTPEDDLRLNRQLIKVGHHTPLRSVQLVFEFSGISKSLQAQWTRHQAGVAWTFRSTRYVPANQNNFIYSTYDYVDDVEKVRELYHIDEEVAKTAIINFDRKRALGASKEDSRKTMPVIFATAGYVYVNAQELRHMFKMRLAKDAEWEIRRFIRMMFDVSVQCMPSLFEDFSDLRNGDW